MGSENADMGLYHTDWAAFAGHHLNISFILHCPQAQLKAGIVKNSDPKHTTDMEKCFWLFFTGIQVTSYTSPLKQ